MNIEFDFLAEKIKEIAEDAEIFYLPNLGNYGDAIIRHGSLNFFSIYKIPINEIFDPNNFTKINNSKKKVLVYGGGGAWCKLWNQSLTTIESLSVFFDKIIILPSTYELEVSIPNCIFFCRDKYESIKNVPNGIFCHDMAFFTKVDNFNDGEGVGNFFRTDKESALQFTPPENNFDLSLRSNHYGCKDLFFKVIAQYSEINTDRLHVAIVAAMLKRKVYLYNSAYFKIEAVYKSSLKPHFNNIEFKQ